ncbi:MAG: twin-arginine translocase subunit TatC [Pseudomonadota bacterium]|nr:twin-arginine translocase subunit TatC [Pseudomonadota bacterium]
MAEKTVEDSKAPLIDHFIELRNRLIRSVSILGFAFFISFIFSNQIYLFLVEPFISEMGNNSEMIFTAPQEFLIVKLKIGLFGALLICLPYLAIEMYSFIAPGLYKEEKVAMVPYFFATPLLFLIGGLLVHYIIMPLALKFFISMQIINDNDGFSITLLPKVSEYLNLVTSLIIAFGLCFQLPVVLSLLARVGFVNSQQLRKGRKYTIVLVFLIAAFLTPPDLISQIGLALPTLILYEISILIVSSIEKKNDE